ncbi:MAG: PilZ domain-containing protein [Gammaproteobacteria bacterium]|jgi:hypothetical protein
MKDTRHETGSACRTVERRGARRLEDCLAATLYARQGAVTGRVVNLSRTGACVEGNKSLADLLHAAGRRAAGAAAPVMLRVQLIIPAGRTGSVPVIVQARVAYVVHVQEETYRCGLEFRLFTGGEAAFAAYLRASGLRD